MMVGLLIAGCGSGGSEPEATISPSPKLVELADACVLVNKAAEETVSSAAGLAKPESLNSFAAALDEIAKKTDERGQDAVQDLATRSREVSETLATSTDATSTDVSARMDAGLDMLNGYIRLQDSCQAVGSPLSVPSG